MVDEVYTTMPVRIAHLIGENNCVPGVMTFLTQGTHKSGRIIVTWPVHDDNVWRALRKRATSAI